MVWNGGTLSNAADPATVTTGGTYTVTATNPANGCTASQTVTVTQTVAVTITTTMTQTNCLANTGTATANVSGGTAPYTYSWSTLPAQTSATATGLSSGSYTVTATDLIGCTQTQTINVTQIPGPNATVNAADINIVIGRKSFWNCRFSRYFNDSN